jgi:hypothetical protein
MHTRVWIIEETSGLANQAGLSSHGGQMDGLMLLRFKAGKTPVSMALAEVQI